MALVNYSALAQNYAIEILNDIASKAGRLSARKFNIQFEQLFDRLAAFPINGSARPSRGRDIRIGIVPPYVVIYRLSKRTTP